MVIASTLAPVPLRAFDVDLAVALAPGEGRASASGCAIGRSRRRISPTGGLAFQHVTFDGVGHARFVIRRGDGPASLEEGRNRVAHHHGHAGCPEHFHIVQIVTEGHHLVAGVGLAPGPLRERRALRASRRQDVDEREVPIRVLGHRRREGCW